MMRLHPVRRASLLEFNILALSGKDRTCNLQQRHALFMPFGVFMVRPRAEVHISKDDFGQRYKLNGK